MNSLLDHSHPRKGKVARLPTTVRDQINALILDGVTYSQILARLGDAVAGITEMNLSNWKNGGYQDWLHLQQRAEYLNSRLASSLQLVRQSPAGSPQQTAQQLLAAQLCEIMVDYDPALFLQHLNKTPELYTRLVSSIARFNELRLHSKPLPANQGI